MSRKWFRKLQHGFLTDKNGFQTSFFVSNKENSAQKPLAVLIHGFGGNAFGVSFLAQELSRDFRILLLEMPNHGASDYRKIQSAHELQSWLEGAILEIEKNFGKASIIICHSMACFSASNLISKKVPTALINPVFETPPRTIFGVKLSSMPFFAVLSNLPIFSPFKALVLIKFWRKKSVKNVFENMIFCIPSPRKIWHQAPMAKIPLSKPFFSGDFTNTAMIFHGTKDALTLPLPNENRAKFFPNSQIFELKTGHLAPIEIPKIIAEQIRKNLNEPK